MIEIFILHFLFVFVPTIFGIKYFKKYQEYNIQIRDITVKKGKQNE